MGRKKICGRRAGTQERVTVHLAVLNPHLWKRIGIFVDLEYLFKCTLNLLRNKTSQAAKKILKKSIIKESATYHTLPEKTHYNTLQYTATHFNNTQHIAIRYSALHCNIHEPHALHYLRKPTIVLCNTLQQTATQWNTLQHSASYWTRLHHASLHTRWH
jgi:hypothetical protein